MALSINADGQGPSMRESAVHLRIAQNASASVDRSAGVVLVGPGDDCAVVAGSTAPLLLTVDHLIEGRHFFGPWRASGDATASGQVVRTTAAQIAWKAIARSVSDIAAMAGHPRWALATAAFAPGTAQRDADALCDALFAAASELGCPLVGGDVATLWDGGSATGAPAPISSPGLVLTTTVGGEAHAKRGPVLRSGAIPGDLICVTGKLGGSLASGRHLSFTPRIGWGIALADVLGPRLHAMMDISDGLGRDGGRLGRASDVELVVELERLPRHPGVADWRAAVGDGEDYELLCCIDGQSQADGELDQLRALGVELTVIGRAEPQQTGASDARRGGCTGQLPDGSRIDLGELGWEHESGDR